MSNKIVEGYYVKYGIGNGNLCLLPHGQVSKDIFINSAPKSAADIQRIDISILGDNYKWI